jgi:flagellar hook-basal body complex protein FliE
VIGAPATGLVPDEPDAPLDAARTGGASPGERVDASGFEAALVEALDGARASFDAASAAERRFAAGTGGLQEMVVARAQADVTLALAAAAASRTTQALGTILGMQV